MVTPPDKLLIKPDIIIIRLLIIILIIVIIIIIIKIEHIMEGSLVSAETMFCLKCVHQEMIKRANYLT